jgi:hypothetical protein
MSKNSIEEMKMRLEQNAAQFQEDLALVARCICPFPYTIALALAQELGIAKALEEKGEMPPDMLAARVSSEVQTINGLFQLLEQMGLARINNKGGTVSLTGQGRRVLTPGETPETVEIYLHLYKLFRSQLAVPGMGTGSDRAAVQLTWPPGSERHSRNFEQYMAAISPYITVWLDEIVDWSGIHNLLDVGGGDGTIAGALCQKYPNLHARVLNLPVAEPLFNETVKKFGVTEQAQFISADFLTDALPSGNHVILFSRVLCDWGDEVVLRLLNQCRSALKENGFVCICEIIHQDNRPWDSDPWFFLWKTMVPGYWQHGPRPLDRWEQIFRQCGLKLVQLKSSPYLILKRLFVMLVEPE